MPRTRGPRIIAGSAKGRRLETPPGTTTRPITDRAKESLFSSLGPDVEDARVLDLYAGSGALALEALSRGAASAVLVDRDRRAVDAARRNVAAAGFEAVAGVERADAAAFLRRPREAGFDLVFCDPPYDLPTSEVEGVLGALAVGWVRSGTIVVLRRRVGDGAPALPAGWRFRRERTFGDTLVLVATAI